MGWMDGWVHKGAWPKDSYKSSHPQVSIMAWSKLEELLLKHLEIFFFSGGGYESCVFYPEKLHVTVMLNSQRGDQKPPAKSQVSCSLIISVDIS